MRRPGRVGIGRLVAAVLLALVVHCAATLGSHAEKTIAVAEDGSDSLECLQGATNCQTLDYALGGVENGTTVMIHYSHNLTSASYLGSSIRNVAIVGVRFPTVRCLDLGVGIGFIGISNVHISGVMWIDCSFQSNIGSEAFTASALFFHKVSNITIENCYFASERGFALAAYDASGTIQILNTSFIGNHVSEEYQCTNQSANGNCSPLGGAVHIKHTGCITESDVTSCDPSETTKYVIDGCEFQNNKNKPTFSFTPSSGLQYWPFSIGGALSILIGGKSSDKSVLVSNCWFENNTSPAGGAINLDMRDEAHANSIHLWNLSLVNNGAVGEVATGGGVRVSITSTFGAYSTFRVSNNEVVLIEYGDDFNFTDVTIQDNYAKWGGGVLILFNSTTLKQSTHTIAFTNCTWKQNSALDTGAALSTINLGVNRNDVSVPMQFQNCVFDSNHIHKNELLGTTIRYGQGAIYSIGVPMYFSGNTSIINNTETAMVVSATVVDFEGDVQFTQNRGLSGAAIFMTDISWLRFHEGLYLLFHQNEAYYTGGAIYYVYPSSRTFNTSETCFMQYANGNVPNVPPSQWKVNISFVENQAVLGGSALYVSDPVGCTWPNGEFLFNMRPKKPLYFFRNLMRDGSGMRYSSGVGTPANNLTFLSPVNFTDDFYVLNIMPGQELTIPVDVNLDNSLHCARSMAQLDVRCFNFSQLLSGEFSEDVCTASSEVDYSGPRVFLVNDSISGITLRSVENYTDLALVFKTQDVQPLISILRVIINECNYGYYYDPSAMSCQCFDDQDGMRCFNINSTTIPCIQTGHWYGPIRVRSGVPTVAEAACPFDRCKSTCDTQCLTLDGWCELPANDHELCTRNHDGPLCALCRDGYSQAYDGLYCVSSSTCSAANIVLFLFLMVVFWVVIVVGLLFVLKLNLRIGSGYLYGFIYYFSVLPYMTGFGRILQDAGFSAFVALFTSIAQLNPSFLSYIKLCFIENMQPVQTELFHYFHPFIVGLLIYVIVLINWHCPSRMSIVPSYSPVHTLCILLLLSFTSLFQTSMNILSPLVFTNAQPRTSDVFVKIQPDVPYFHPTKHLPYALPALAIELFIVIPFTLFMLSAPWLMRWRRMIKYKPIFDEYQACYRDRYRWFAGYYLVARHLMALTTFVPITVATSTLLQQLLSFTILLIHAYIKPYQERWLNLIDTIFLADLLIFSILSGNTPNTVFNDPNLNAFGLSIQYTLILIPCLYFIIACVVFISVKIRSWWHSKFILGRKTSVTASETSHTNSLRESYDMIFDRERENTELSLSLHRSTNENNPLLETGDTSQDGQNEQGDEQRNRAHRSITQVQNYLGRVGRGVIEYWRNSPPTNSGSFSRLQEDSLLFDRSGGYN